MQHRYLKLTTAKHILQVAIDVPKSSSKLCRKKQATIAVGDAVMGLSVSVIQQRLEYINAQVVAGTSEILIETRFKPHKLRKHAMRVRQFIEVPLYTLHNEMASDSVTGTMLSHLDKPEVKECKKAISSALKILIKAINLIPKKVKKTNQLSSSEIKELLMNRLAPELICVSDNLGEAMSQIQAIGVEVEGEWKDCVELLKKCC